MNVEVFLSNNEANMNLPEDCYFKSLSKRMISSERKIDKSKINSTKKRGKRTKGRRRKKIGRAHV